MNSAPPCVPAPATRKKKKRVSQARRGQLPTIDPAKPRTLPEIAFTRNHISRNVARKRFVSMRWELVLMLDVLKDYRAQCERESAPPAAAEEASLAH